MSKHPALERLPELSTKGAVATRFHGRGSCWMCSFDRKTAPAWECTVKNPGGIARMILCEQHGQSWIRETKARVVDG